LKKEAGEDARISPENLRARGELGKEKEMWGE